MIHILYIIHRYRRNYPLLNLQVRLNPDKFRITVCFLSGENDGKNQLDADGYDVVYLGCKELRLRNVPLIFRLKRIMEERCIDVVNCQQHRSTPLGVAAAVLAKQKPAVISTLHGLGTAATWRRKCLNWLLYKKLDRIVGISHGVSQDIVTSNWCLPAAKVATIQNGLDYDAFLAQGSKEDARNEILPGKTEGFWFGTAGRLSPVKNQRTLIVAFSKIALNRRNAHLLIAGTGELAAELENLVNKLNLHGQVHFLGYRRDMPLVFRALDVFVLPSLREGLPLAMLEAMASGLPVIAARVGGIPEVFGEQDLGRLIEPRDPSSLVAAIQEMVEASPERLAAQGRVARLRATEDFSSRRMISGYERLYEQVCAVKNARHRNS
ncbi:glycosyltransferase [bacterium]|nr:glycosyltransferase [bacterium]